MQFVLKKVFISYLILCCSNIKQETIETFKYYKTHGAAYYMIKTYNIIINLMNNNEIMNVRFFLHIVKKLLFIQKVI